MGAHHSGFSAPGDEDAVRVQQLAKVTAALGAAETIDEVVDAAVTHIADAIRARVTTLMLREGDDLVLVGGHGLQPGVAEQWHVFPVDHANPASEAVRVARPVLVGDRAEIAARYGSFVENVPPGRSVVCLPLGAGAAPVGVVGLTFDDLWLPGPRELDLLMTFGEACGQAIRRIRSATEAAERARLLGFLADASAELSSSLDYRATLAKVASLCVPVLADWCAVDVLERGSLTTLAVAHADPERVAWAWQLQRRYPPDPDAPTGAPNVIRTGRSELYPVIDDAMLVAGARDEEHLRLARELKLRSALVVPLQVRHRTLGAITLIRADTERHYGPGDLAVAEDLGRRAAVAIDNARLHSAARDAAIQLQRAALPDDLGGIAGWQVAAQYVPGGGDEVGGDFYDAVELADGRLAVFVGDVMGHGVPAAAAMAQLRSAIRAYLSVDPAPETVLARLQRMYAQLAIRQFASIVYAVLDPAGPVELVNAGHYPPLVVRAGGAADFADTPTRRVLGAGPDCCTGAHVELGADDTLLLFTDGLIERRDEHIDAGLQRLREAASALARADVRTALPAVVATVCSPSPSDDLTAVAVRRARVHRTLT